MKEKALYYTFKGRELVGNFHLGYPNEFEPFCQIKKDFKTRSKTFTKTYEFDEEVVCSDCLNILKLIENL